MWPVVVLVIVIGGRRANHQTRPRSSPRRTMPPPRRHDAPSDKEPQWIVFAGARVAGLHPLAMPLNHRYGEKAKGMPKSGGSPYARCGVTVWPELGRPNPVPFHG